LEIALLALALLLYTTGVLCSFFGTTRDAPRLHRLSAAALSVAWGFHLAAIVVRGVRSGGIPLANSAEFLMVFGWVVLTFHLLVWFRWKVDIAGLVLPPLAELMVIASIGLVPVTSAPEPYSATPWWFVAHTGA
jgi:ABC-type transport system involved in cytochrome c biogenesis permease subunit